MGKCFCARSQKEKVQSEPVYCARSHSGFYYDTVCVCSYITNDNVSVNVDAVYHTVGADGLLSHHIRIPLFSSKFCVLCPVWRSVLTSLCPPVRRTWTLSRPRGSLCTDLPPSSCQENLDPEPAEGFTMYWPASVPLSGESGPWAGRGVHQSEAGRGGSGGGGSGGCRGGAADHDSSGAPAAGEASPPAGGAGPAQHDPLLTVCLPHGRGGHCAHRTVWWVLSTSLVPQPRTPRPGRSLRSPHSMVSPEYISCTTAAYPTAGEVTALTAQYGESWVHLLYLSRVPHGRGGHRSHCWVQWVGYCSCTSAVKLACSARAEVTALTAQAEICPVWPYPYPTWYSTTVSLPTDNRSVTLRLWD